MPRRIIQGLSFPKNNRPKFKLHSFTTGFSGLSNVLYNKVLISQAFDSTSEQVDPKDCGAREYMAIWDTGATGTAITKKVVDECGLKPTGVAVVHTAAGESKTNTYLVNVWLPNRVMVPNVRAALGELIGTDVLIGMNIINQGDFAVTNKDGKTVFSFRLPSVECLDFVDKPFKTKPIKTIPSRKRFGH